MSYVRFDWPIYTEKDGKEIETVYEVEVYYSYDPGCYTLSNGDPGYPPSEESILEVVRLDGKKIPEKEWEARGFTKAVIEKIEDGACHESSEQARDAEDERGDQKYHELKDEGLL